MCKSLPSFCLVVKLVWPCWGFEQWKKTQLLKKWNDTNPINSRFGTIHVYLIVQHDDPLAIRLGVAKDKFSGKKKLWFRPKKKKKLWLKHYHNLISFSFLCRLLFVFYHWQKDKTNYGYIYKQCTFTCCLLFLQFFYGGKQVIIFPKKKSHSTRLRHKWDLDFFARANLFI